MPELEPFPLGAVAGQHSKVLPMAAIDRDFFGEFDNFPKADFSCTTENR